ncbi:anti-sigma factor domain-containing protein [Cytobacillus sp. S13-E01]|uniref:anti-sigma factor domain-containing protein n=1 Tax=Cytobacillus sp. S13-E01 TaxID=3031326 RepID=UPI0023D88AE9|nr:anti-sigma factor domain-containing protein [Cytobacillus sp. S13-E01]MDF0728448.1 anti-sigma factor domain-containing protein [Cytobacillus sp. S13-E01]
MKKGVIMEVNHDFLIMMTPEGEFLKAKNQNHHYEIGEELDFFPVTVDNVRETPKQRYFQFSKLKLAFVGFAAALLFLLTFIPNLIATPVYAYMSIDINPSFEIGVDDRLRVISLEALNTDGDNILKDYTSWKKQDVEMVAETIINKSREEGYLAEGEEVLITTVLNEKKVEDVSIALAKELESISTVYESEKIAITAVESDKETREKAQKQGVSTGRLLQLENKLPANKDQNNDKKDDEKVSSENKDDDSDEQKDDSNKEIDSNDQKGIGKEKVKEKAEEIIKEADTKKEKIREKVKENIDNSNMPDHVKEKVKDKLNDLGSNGKKKDDEEDEDDDNDEEDEEDEDDKEDRGKGREK